MTAPGALVYTLELPEATPSNNTIKAMHFRVYGSLRKKWRRMVEGALPGGTGHGGPIGLAHLEIERYSAGALDWDNAYGGLKPLLDCLVLPTTKNPDGLGLIADDNPRAMPRAPELTQHTAKKSEGRTVVRIYSLRGG